MKNRLVIVFIVLLALTEPWTHYSLHRHSTQTRVFSGVHTGDSAHHMICLHAGRDLFFSPFASHEAEDEGYSMRYFAVPFFLVYAALGLAGEWCARLFFIPEAAYTALSGDRGAPPQMFQDFAHIGDLFFLSDFVYLGLINGIAAAAFLYSLWCFFRRVLPTDALARRAFVLYALGAGGIGGLIFLFSKLTGLSNNPGFELWFARFARYELIEGQYLSPVLLMPRLYYTLPLALGFSGLTLLFPRSESDEKPPMLPTGILLFAATWMNMRLGPMFWGIGLLFLTLDPSAHTTEKGKRIVLLSASVFLASLGALAVLWQHPSYLGNVKGVTQEMMHLIPFLYTTLFCWPLLVWALRPSRLSGPPWLRFVFFACLGYLLAYALLYAAYIAYYGNWLRGGDMQAALFASDLALLGALAGTLLARFTKSPKTKAVNTPPAWIALWFLGGLCLALSTWGQGWWLRFSPERFMVCLGPPLALLCAWRLEALRPSMRRAYTGLLILLGLASTLTGIHFFQGPFYQEKDHTPFAWLHYDAIDPADAPFLADVPEGVILCPPWSPISFGEIVAVHSMNRKTYLLGGPGALNLGDQDFAPLQEAITRFFSPDTDMAFRKAFCEHWQVDYIYCPATTPVSDEIAHALRAAPWLEQLPSEENTLLFHYLVISEG